MDMRKKLSVQGYGRNREQIKPSQRLGNQYRLLRPQPLLRQPYVVNVSGSMSTTICTTIQQVSVNVLGLDDVFQFFFVQKELTANRYFRQNNATKLSSY